MKRYHLIIASLVVVILSMGVFGFFYFVRQMNPLEVVLPRGIASSQPKPLYLLEGGEADGFNRPLGVTTDGSGRIYVADSANNRIVVYSPNGKFLFTFGKFGPGQGELNYPTSVAVTKDGLIAVSDFHNRRIQIFDDKGEFLRLFPKDAKKPLMPAVLALGENDVLYVSDVGSQQIVKFSVKGEELGRFGSPGGGEGQLNYANGITVDRKSGRIFVSDSNNARVQVFDGDGSISHVFDSGSGMVNPRGVAYYEKRNSLYVVDTFGHRIFVFDKDNKLARTFSSRGLGESELNFPNGIHIDSRGRIYITDRENNRISVWSY